MAIYHFTAKIVSRGKGQSAVAKAAYNSRQRLDDERSGEHYDYRSKGQILFSGVFAPHDAPDWVHDRARLYNEIERCEKRKDAQLVREVEIGLPHELTEEQRERLVKDFVREQFVRKGMVADVAIHAPDPEGDERNHHAHILLTMREVGPDGFGPKVRDWNSKQQLEIWREAWERTANRYLERHGHDARIDRRTLEEQGIDREPGIHRGPHVDAMERDGVATDRGFEARTVKELNLARAELAMVEREIRLVEIEAQLDRASHRQRDREGFSWEPAPARDFNLQQAGQVVERLAGLVLDTASDGFEKSLDRAATSFESLFETEPRRAVAPARPRRQEPEEKTDLARYLADDDYRRQLAQREIEERQRREQDDYRRRERDRGDRDR